MNQNCNHAWFVYEEPFLILHDNDLLDFACLEIRNFKTEFKIAEFYNNNPYITYRFDFCPNCGGRLDHDRLAKDMQQAPDPRI